MPHTVFTGLLSLLILATVAACQPDGSPDQTTRPAATPQPIASSPAPGSAPARVVAKLTIPPDTQPDLPTAPAVPTRLPGSIPTATPLPPTDVNGIPIDQFVIMPPAVQANMRQIFAAGQALGRNARAYSKAGDSTIENPHFLTRFDSGPYKLGQYAYLQDIIDVYRGSHARASVAVRRGIHAWSIMNPQWADKNQCEPNEGPLQCEIRLHNPSLVIFRLGSNDVGTPKSFEQGMQKAITYCIQSGVIPIIGTKADRHEGEGNINNTILRELAAGNNVPLWDFDLVAQTLPNAGIDPVDGTHMTFFFAHDYTDPIAFTKGHAVHNLTALIMLDRVWKVLNP